MLKSSAVTTGLTRRALLGAAAGLSLAALEQQQARAQPAPEWRNMTTEDAPPPRWDHTLAADDEGRALIVFGGRGDDFAPLGDTWRYSFADRAWSQIDAPGPEPRFGHAVAVDQTARRMILFGGQSADLFFNDAWAYDLTSSEWTLLDDGSNGAPSPRYGLAAVLDADNRMLVSHGFTFEGRFNDTWALDVEAAAWTDVSPIGEAIRPLNRCLHELAWDPATRTMLLYGGCSSGFGPCPQGDTWRFDPATHAWTDITPAISPPARTNPALVHDRSGQRVLLIGGSTGAGYAADVWAGVDGGESFTWTQLAPIGDSPAGRASHDAVTTRGDVYLFGGIGDNGALNDLWKLSQG